MRDIAVFSGSAHHDLAVEVCSHLGVPLHPVRVSRFATDCLEVQLQENCRERDVFLIQPLVAPVQEHLVELLLMLDAARGASAARTTVVMPYYAYACCLVQHSALACTYASRYTQRCAESDAQRYAV